MINPNFFKLLIASAASNLGDGLALIAFPWLASLLTRDPLLIALVSLFGRAPWLLFSLPAGVIIDRFDRRKLIFLTDVARTVLTAIVFVVVLSSSSLLDPAAVVGGTQVEPDGVWLILIVIYAAALLLGTAEVLRDNAAQTILPSIVAPHQLENANSKLATVELVMNSLVGPPLAGFLIAVSLAFAFAANAGALFLAALMVFLIGGNFLASREPSQQENHWMHDLKAGLNWLWQHILLRDLAIILGLVNAAYMMTLATQVLFAQEVLYLDPTEYGLLLTGAAFGGVAGGFAAPYLAKYVRSGTLMAISLLMFMGETLVFGFTSNAVVAWLALFVSSFAAVVWNVISVSLRQNIIPDQLLGRVNSVYRFLSWGLMPLGTLIGGVLVGVFEPSLGREFALRSPFFVAGAIMALVLIISLFRLTNAKIEAARANAT
ncbi:MFS transporter [Maritalea sp.]|uniref:MFS transporter n=1 Tax=Maritalea sp. TaxID=2003361 RepID=UPI003EF66311